VGGGALCHEFAVLVQQGGHQTMGCADGQTAGAVSGSNTTFHPRSAFYISVFASLWDSSLAASGGNSEIPMCTGGETEAR